MCDCTLWPALYLKTEDLEGQNVDYQWFEIQSIKIENKKETQYELQNRLIFKFSLESYVVIFANFYLGMACSWIFFSFSMITMGLWKNTDCANCWQYIKNEFDSPQSVLMKFSSCLLNM